MSGRSELTQRIAVGLILIIVAVTQIWFGGTAFWIFATAAGLIMLSEFAGLVGASDHHRRWALYALCLPLGVVSPLALGIDDFFSLGLLFGMATAVWIVSRNAALGAGLVYVGLPVFALLWLRDRPDGLLLTFWALTLVWATDIGAFFAGRTIGGPKVAPAISPNKTWAGLLGGVIAATLLALVLRAQLGLASALVAVTPILAFAAQAGDFFESWMKRRAGVKDSGTLLPGHGGVLDRLDGVVTSAPLAALTAALIAAP